MARLNLGCGTHTLEGFINLDLSVNSEGTRGGTQTLKWDLSNGLPNLDAFGDPITDVDFIYTCHFIEHCTDRGAFELLKICYDRMAEGGEIRILVPDFKAIVQHYLDNDHEFFGPVDPPPIDRPIPAFIDHITYCVYQYGEHKSIWDRQKFERYLTGIGFKVNDSMTEYGHPFDPKCPVRAKYSLVVQAEK